MDLDKEKQLVEKALNDRMAFGVLFDHYYPVILSYAVKRTADAAAAQDITAETFLKAMTNLQKFKWRGLPLSNWLYKIATNEIRMYYRRGKYHPLSLDVLFEDGLEFADEREFTEEIIDAQDRLERQADYRRARAALVTLPLKYQEVIMLRFVERKKISDIALILGKKEGTVKSILSRGLQRLRNVLLERQTQPNAAADIRVTEGQLLISPEAYEK